ncbi:MAG: cytochrome c3 family protein [Caldilineales bacterium]|nr:cytochrome c3 family protein [Caldilineales bacterium]
MPFLSRLPIAALTLALALLFLAGIPTTQAAPPAQSGDPNNTCLACHGIPDREIELANGEVMSLYVDAEVFSDSVHGQEHLTCTACHTNISGYPHPPLNANSRRDFQIDRYEACRNCHSEQYDATLDSMHAKLLAGGNRDAAICTDCHGSHDISNPHEPRQQVSATCSQCHATIFDNYKESVHGAALFDESNPDVPTCVDCHGVHSMEDPRTAEFRIKSPELCGECHADEALMSKYGISTDVFNTYVADFHGTTVTLFERQSPDQLTNKAVCYDCHGIHNIKAIDDPNALVVKENLLVTCQRCHPDADANFPTSWTSHYIPDKEHNPLVYYINLFYLLIIPGTIGFMIAFVSLDAIRRIVGRIFGRGHDQGHGGEGA